MTRTDTIIIGGGQAGLAMSRCLTARGVDHLVLERGRVAERWRSERWDSLRLLTPNWMTRLPGWRYSGPDMDGFMAADEVAAFLDGYARSFAAPVLGGTEVTELARSPRGYRIATSRGVFEASAVVIATGQCDRPHVPAFASGLPDAVEQITPTAYRGPEALARAGVLVVGASATGVQLAHEIHASGRPVTLSVSRHTRLPRTYRGRDIMWWLDRSGVLTERWDEVDDIERARAQPSLQLVGRPDRRAIDLGTLSEIGVRLVGRTTGVDGSQVAFADDLADRIARTDDKLRRLLERIDGFIAASREPAGPKETIAPLSLNSAAPCLDLSAEGIATVVWASGYRRNYGWLKVPVLDGAGEIRHDGGLTAAPGLYVLGLRFLRRRKSSFIDGVGIDAEELSAHLLGFLNQNRLAA
jgi:putative flavoprotein involved in K+ transport